MSEKVITVAEGAKPRFFEWYKTLTDEFVATWGQWDLVIYKRRLWGITENNEVCFNSYLPFPPALKPLCVYLILTGKLDG